jgi:ribosome-associated translation inhibitor RaiA
MTDENVSSVFVVDGGRSPRVLAQSDLLGLIVARARTSVGRQRVEDIYVEITGLRGAADPALLADIDQLVAKGLGRIARYVRPSLLSLHFAPHSTHRTNDLTVEARLHTVDGIYFASHTGWNLMVGVSGLMEELAAQTRRARDEARDRARRSRRVTETEESTPVDAELEAKIRAATRDSEE